MSKILPLIVLIASVAVTLSSCSTTEPEPVEEQYIQEYETTEPLPIPEEEEEDVYEETPTTVEATQPIEPEPEPEPEPMTMDQYMENEQASILPQIESGLNEGIEAKDPKVTNSYLGSLRELNKNAQNMSPEFNEKLMTVNQNIASSSMAAYKNDPTNAVAAVVAYEVGMMIGEQDEVEQQDLMVAANSDQSPKTNSMEPRDYLVKKLEMEKSYTHSVKTNIGQFVDITLDEVINDGNAVSVGLRIKNRKPLRQLIYLESLEMINESSKSLASSEVSNKWALPGDNTRYNTDSIPDGWTRLNERVIYKVFAPLEESPAKFNFRGEMDLVKQKHRLSITCNAENFEFFNVGKAELASQF